ncbi:MAG TPA: archaellin/type IV pilin N-terminal domain-containing protein [Candidatus Acidoferrum sp.]|nr:archaellin/type IV pilin N-terminal domain-containing protein [Candidatus Acidoferrum sp.]
MRKLYRNKKGISPVISTILMIMVAMVGMSVAFSYVVVYSDTYKAGVGSSVLESLTIEDIWFRSDTGAYNNVVTIGLYNSGEIGAIVKTIYVNGIAATNGSSDYNLNINIPVGQHIQVTVQGLSSWTPGTKYDFKITTMRGSNFDKSITAT